jgi:hypothetical protein
VKQKASGEGRKRRVDVVTIVGMAALAFLVRRVVEVWLERTQDRAEAWDLFEWR